MTHRLFQMIMMVLATLFLYPICYGQVVQKQVSREFERSSIDHLTINHAEGNIDITVGDSNKLSFDILIQVSETNQSIGKDLLDKIQIQFEENDNRLMVSLLGIANEWKQAKATQEVKINYRVQVPPDIQISLASTGGNIFVETLNSDLSVQLADGNLSLGDINGKLALHMISSTGKISQIRDGEFQLVSSQLEMEDANHLTMEMDKSFLRSGTIEKFAVEASESEVYLISVGTFSYEGKHDSIQIETADSIRCISSGSDIHIQELHQWGQVEVRHGDTQIDRIFPGLSSLAIKSAYGNAALKLEPGTAYAIEAHLKHGTLFYNQLRVIENINKKNHYAFKASHGKANVPIQIQLHYGELMFN